MTPLKPRITKIELCKLHYFYSIYNMSFEQKSKHDSEKIMRFIESHPKFDAIYSAFTKGPEPECGFMWTTTEWWTQEEGEAIEIVSNKVLEYDWDSSGYGYMMRVIQAKIKELPVATAEAVQDDLQDDESKYAGDPRTGKGSPFYKTVKSFQLDELEEGKNFAKSYQQTQFGEAMNDNNKKALDVMAKKGANKAANYMMAQAGGDYGRMRSMFG